MKKLLLITGDIAAGKSTFSQILSARYSAAVFQKDTVKEILGEWIGFQNRERCDVSHIFSDFANKSRPDS